MNFIKTLSLLFFPFLSTICFSQIPLSFGSGIKTADPSDRVWKDGKMYPYTSHDEECQKDFWMKDWHVFSSEDLINRTDN